MSRYSVTSSASLGRSNTCTREATDPPVSARPAPQPAHAAGSTGSIRSGGGYPRQATAPMPQLATLLPLRRAGVLPAGLPVGIRARPGTAYPPPGRHAVTADMVCPTTPRPVRRVRRSVGDRCDWRCVYCHRPLAEGAPDPADRPTLDHLIPRSKHGSNQQRNLVLACHDCNNGKGDTDPAEWLPTCGYPAGLHTARAVIAHARRARIRLIQAEVA